MAFPIDGEEQSADFKKPPEGRASTSKRTRTAEVHNRSERVGFNLLFACTSFFRLLRICAILGLVV
jgi:hypothetical protein